MEKIILTKSLVEELYKNGLSIKKIGKQLGYSDKTIRNFMVENNIKINIRNNEELNQDIKDEIILLYLNGLNPREISNELNITQSKIKSFLVSNNIWKSKEDLNKEELVYLYRIKKMSIRDIARLKKCSLKKVQNALKKYKIKKLNYIFNKEELTLLYSKYNLSCNEIAKIKNTTKWFVEKALNEYNIV